MESYRIDPLILEVSEPAGAGDGLSRQAASDDEAAAHAGCSLLTNHALVLIHISQNPTATLRDIGNRAGITERATHAILVALIRAGYVLRERAGTRNRYTVHRHRRILQPNVAHVEVSRLLDALT